MTGRIENVFCFRYGKMEPERLLSGVHMLGPTTEGILRDHFSRGQVDRWLPFLLRRGDVARKPDGGLVCCCGGAHD
jgi:hypothetical protein